MKYVYLLESIEHPEEPDVGLTDDLRARSSPTIRQSKHTAKFMPWCLITYVAFSDEAKAVAFERYSRRVPEEPLQESVFVDGWAKAGRQSMAGTHRIADDPAAGGAGHRPAFRGASLS